MNFDVSHVRTISVIHTESVTKLQDLCLQFDTPMLYLRAAL